MGWTLASAEFQPFGWSPWPSGSCSGYERPSVAAKVLWQITPPSFSYLRLWTWSRVDYSQRRTISWPASHLHLRLRSRLPLYLPCQCAKQMHMRCVFGGACACLRSLAVGPVWGLTPAGCPELHSFFRVSIWFNERKTVVSKLSNRFYGECLPRHRSFHHDALEFTTNLQTRATMPN